MAQMVGGQRGTFRTWGGPKSLGHGRVRVLSEKRDLWVPALLALTGLGLFIWHIAGSGSVPIGILALLVGAVGALYCLPLRMRYGQGRVVLHGVGVMFLLLCLRPELARTPSTVLAYVLAAGAFLVPLPSATIQLRAIMLGAGGALRVARYPGSDGSDSGCADLVVPGRCALHGGAGLERAGARGGGADTGPDGVRVRRHLRSIPPRAPDARRSSPTGERAPPDRGRGQCAPQVRGRGRRCRAHGVPSPRCHDAPWRRAHAAHRGARDGGQARRALLHRGHPRSAAAQLSGGYAVPPAGRGGHAPGLPQLA